MDLTKAQLNQYRLHAVTLLTGLAAGLSQVDELSKWSPVAAACAFLVSSSSYKEVFSRVDALVDSLEEADVIDEDIAGVVDEATDVAESLVDGNNDE